MIELLRRVQPIARWRDFLDERAGRGWYAPIGTYDGTKAGRPFRHLRCSQCGGAHHRGHPMTPFTPTRWSR